MRYPRLFQRIRGSLLKIAWRIVEHAQFNTALLRFLERLARDRKEKEGGVSETE